LHHAPTLVKNDHATHTDINKHAAKAVKRSSTYDYDRSIQRANKWRISS